MYALRHEGLYSCFISSTLLNIAWRLERKSHTSRSHGGKSSRHLCPIQRELIQKAWIVSVAANLEELTLEAFVRLLEKGQQNSPSNLVKTHPQFLTWVFGFQEVKEYVHR